ncbi:MAG: DNA-processing protein DprA [Qingshengfaniella sp.]
MTQQLFSFHTTPLTPPTSEEDRLSWLRLYRSRRVGAATFRRLMGEHGSAEAALAALPGIAEAAGVRDYQTTTRQQAEAEWRSGLKHRARLICMGDPEYPTLLADISDAPPLFWAVGDTTLLSRPLIGMVGTRRCSSLGERMARHLAGGLGEAGLTVVSGMARGIDAAAHDAALPYGTIAVLGGGADIIYPPENTSLYHNIRNRGLVISEQPMGLPPQARHFPQRNRIISGLCMGLIVVEAAAKSGSLITARNAGDQGREVMAVPGHPFDARASGCNMLLRDGATLIRSTPDVLEVLGHDPEQAPLRPAQPARPRRSLLSRKPAAPPATPVPTPPSPAKHRQDARELPAEILSRLSAAPLNEDQLIRDLGLSAAVVGPALIDLELDGLAIRHPGGLVSLAPPS